MTPEELSQLAVLQLQITNRHDREAAEIWRILNATAVGQEANRQAIANLTTQQEANRQAIANLATQQEANQQTIANLATQQDANQQAIANLATQQEANQQAIANLATQQEANQQTIANLATQQEANRQAIANLATQQEANQQTIANLTASIAELPNLVGDYPLPGRRLYFFKRGAGVEPLAGGNAPTPPLNQNLWASAVYLQGRSQT